MKEIANTAAGIANRDTLKIAVCALVAAFEGFDVTASGLAGPTMIQSFALSPAEYGLTATAFMSGFFFGASGGGILGDRYGRRRVMVLSLGLAGLFALLTTRTETLPLLLIMRFFTGLGVGGVFPNVLAIAADSVPPSLRGRAITLTGCGTSIGGILAALLLTAGGQAVTWRTFFEVGGLAPLLIAPIAWAILPERECKASSVTRQTTTDVLFGKGRTTTTLLLWLVTFLTASVTSFFGSWSPTLLSQRGLSSSEVGTAVTVLSISSMVGALFLATLLDRGSRSMAVMLAYGGMIIALVGFTLVYSVPLVWASMASLGLTVFAGQLMLFAIIPTCYPLAHRSTGLGASVAAGRIGSMVFPSVIGWLLGQGMGRQGVLLVLVPLVLVAGLSAVFVTRQQPLES